MKEIARTEIPKETDKLLKKLKNAMVNRKAASQVKTETHVLQDMGYEARQAPIREADFAFNFGRKLFAGVPKADNFVCSPLSVWLPLAALANATDAKHKPALLSALGASGVTEQQINDYAQTLLYQATDAGDREREKNQISPLKIANALFVSRNHTLKQAFAQMFADNYLGTAFTVDFQSPDAATAVKKEKGTTAAAVTVTGGPTSSRPLPPTEPFKMICDKPFVFVLESCGQVLFTGVVNNPALRQ
jgi:serine protease inhibitor